MFKQAELIAEGDEELSIAFSLIEGKGEEAAEVILSFFDLDIKKDTFEKYAAIWY